MVWGILFDCFYIGLLDGVVKVWDIRFFDKLFVRILFEVLVFIVCGVFFLDKLRLVVGDVSG